MAGRTNSYSFPKTTGGAQGRYGGNWDAFVTRLNSDLTQIIQSTYLGGSYEETANALAIHPTTGEVYVAGMTDSTNFPKTTGGAQATKTAGKIQAKPVSNSDAFVARLNKELTQILQATYLGGSGWDQAYTLAIHPTTGEVYVAGYTNSDDFPKTDGGAHVSISGNSDAFVARLKKELTQNTPIHLSWRRL